MSPGGFRIRDDAAAIRFCKAVDGSRSLGATCCESFDGMVSFGRQLRSPSHSRPAHEPRLPLSDVVELDVPPAFAVQGGLGVQPPPP